MRAAGGIAITAVLAGCSSGLSAARLSASPQGRPERILAAPSGVVSAAQPQPNGTMWVLAGSPSSRGLFRMDLGTGRSIGSVSVSGDAKSVAQSLNGTIGLAIGTRTSGALELLNGSTATVAKTVPLGAPARGAAIGADGTTFYVLDGNRSSASVTVVNSISGRIQGTVSVPLNTTSVIPSPDQTRLYTLQADGLVSEIAVAGGKEMDSFTVGDPGKSVTISPDGSTLYVLKDASGEMNVAVVSLATDIIRKVMPAPAHSVQVVISADGNQLYELSGTAAYGNIQIFGV